MYKVFRITGKSYFNIIFVGEITWNKRFLKHSFLWKFIYISWMEAVDTVYVEFLKKKRKRLKAANAKSISNKDLRTLLSAKDAVHTFSVYK